MFAVGAQSTSVKSITNLLNTPDGGKFGILVVGGAEESMYSRPGDYYFVLKKRRGFVKLALKTGAPLVPVITFGEIEVFTQPSNPPQSLYRTLQCWSKRLFGFTPVISMGRGFFQYSFGILPRRNPIAVVGKLNYYFYYAEPPNIHRLQNY